MHRKYINYPKKVDLSYYENARHDIINYFSEDKNLESIYEFGTVQAPGVSDIDIMLVFKENPIQKSKYDFREINNNVFSLVANGNVIKMDKSTFACLEYIDNFKFNLIYGNSIKQNPIPEKLINIREIVSICDWLPERIKRIQMVLSKSSLNISWTLCLLNSITYSIKNVEFMTSKIENSDKLFNLISSLRTNWYDLTNPELLLEDSLEMSIEVGLDAISKIINILMTKIAINLSDNKYSTNDIKVPMHYEIQLEFDKSLSFNSLEQYRKDKTIRFPGILAHHFINLAYLPTQISKRLSLKLFNHDINPFLYLENEYINYLYIKSSLISENLHFLEKNKFKGGLVRYGFYA